MSSAASRTDPATTAELPSVIDRKSLSGADCIRVGLQLACCGVVALVAEQLDEALRLLGNVEGQLGTAPSRREDVREDEKLEGFDPIRERTDHTTSPDGDGDGVNIADDPKAIAARVMAHRLSEASE